MLFFRAQMDLPVARPPKAAKVSPAAEPLAARDDILFILHCGDFLCGYIAIKRLEVIDGNDGI